MRAGFIALLCLLAVIPTIAFHLSKPRFLPVKTTTYFANPAVGIYEKAVELSSNILLADTSISEEEVLSVTGQASDLPDPLYAVGFALIVFLGVALLQLSLGDLTKEVKDLKIFSIDLPIFLIYYNNPIITTTQEGQARVKDFLQTKRETERKRGYFD